MRNKEFFCKFSKKLANITCFTNIIESCKRYDKFKKMGEDNFILRFSDSLKRSKGNRKRQSGQGVLEYALILVFIALTVIVILTVVGGQAGNTFSNVSNLLGGNKVNLSSYNDEFTSSWSGNGGGNGWKVFGSPSEIDSNSWILELFNSDGYGFWEHKRPKREGLYSCAQRELYGYGRTKCQFCFYFWFPRRHAFYSSDRLDQKRG